MLKTEDKKHLKEQDYAALNPRQEKNRSFNRVRCWVVVRGGPPYARSVTLTAVVAHALLLRFRSSRSSRLQDSWTCRHCEA